MLVPDLVKTIQGHALDGARVLRGCFDARISQKEIHTIVFLVDVLRLCLSARKLPGEAVLECGAVCAYAPLWLN